MTFFTKLYLYHTKELQYRIFYTFFTWACFFSITFFNMEFLLDRILPYNLLPDNFKATSRAVTTASSRDNVMSLSGSNVENSNTLLESLQRNFTITDPTLLQDNNQINSLGDPLTGGLIFTDIFEGFFSYLLLSGYLALLFTIPFLYYHVYKFLLPGLTYQEGFLLKYFFITSTSLIYFAHILIYTLLLPYAINFFLSFQTYTIPTSEPLSELDLYRDTGLPQNGLTFLGRVYPWITFLINLFTTASFLFQLPLFLFVITILILPQIKTGFVAPGGETNPIITQLRSLTPNGHTFGWSTLFLRKILFFLLVLLTAIFSPPDLYSQFLLFLPLFLMVEFFIFIVSMYIVYTSRAVPTKP